MRFLFSFASTLPVEQQYRVATEQGHRHNTITYIHNKCGSVLAGHSCSLAASEALLLALDTAGSFIARLAGHAARSSLEGTGISKCQTESAQRCSTSSMPQMLRSCSYSWVLGLEVWLIRDPVVSYETYLHDLVISLG